MPSEPILIVDDNAANLKLARLLLTAEGHDARTAIDAEQALKLLETFKPAADPDGHSAAGDGRPEL